VTQLRNKMLEELQDGSEILSTTLSPTLRLTPKQKRSSSKRNSFTTETDDLSSDEFLPSFPLHLLFKGFVRIRYFGFLANRRRATLLPLCFQLLGAIPQPQTEPTAFPARQPNPLSRCPQCGGTMVIIQTLTAAQILLRSPPSFLRTL
jgi:hypothetical protein